MQHLPLVDDFVGSIFETGRYRCPVCTPERKKNNRLDLQVTVEHDRTLYKCHHCTDIEGMIMNKTPASLDMNNAPLVRKKYEPLHPTVTHIPTALTNNKQIISNFFSQRGIDVDGLDLEGHVVTTKKYFMNLNENLDAIGFTYPLNSEETQAVKWRPADTNKKAFTQDGAARMFYGLRPMAQKEDQIIIVEGEADVIALASIGITSWSVPNGAPMKISGGRIDPQEDGKFSYVWENHEELVTAKRVILATDRDTAGDALKHELARRIGLELCWEIKLPDGCKDVTDAIKDKGSDAVKNLFENTKRMPLKGVYDVDSYFEQVESLYEDGEASGHSTGLQVVDELFTIKEGMMYIVTGFPGCGKSEFIDEIMINMAKSKQWKWAVASFENPPASHISKLMEKVTGKPFFEGRSQRLSHEEMHDSKSFLNEHFVFLEQKDGSMPTIKEIIAKTKLAIARCGCRGIVIDPYNYINMSEYESEHTGISVMLSELSSFARAHEIAVFFVAHPQKIQNNIDGTMPVPKGGHISGSAAWWAKADIGITVQRGDHDVDIHCWKARFKWLGKEGKATIGYNVINGKYFDTISHRVVEWGAIDEDYTF